ncbi:MAG: phosphoribosyl-AMP cyclohydrolase [Candidatus Bathyarchaeia archaeon]
MIKLDRARAQAVADSLNYNHNGLVIAIAQDVESSEVLMAVFMDPNSVVQTLISGKAHYFSTRRGLWLKGERSGHFQEVEELLVDCDMNALLLKVRQTGGACHLGYKSCFFRRLRGSRFIKFLSKIFKPQEVYGDRRE